MQKVNLLIVSTKKSPNLEYFLSSKYLKKLYVTTEDEVDGAVNIRYNTFRELAEKCKALQIDFVLVEEELLILQGIGDVLRKNFINCIAPFSPWTKLANSNTFAKALLDRYEIDTPPVMSFPSEFPILVKGDGVLKKANTIQDIIKIKEDVFKKSEEIAKTVFLEKYLDGEKYTIISLFDGKHLLTFPNENIDLTVLQIYSQKLEKMLVDEHANFIGFINSKVIPLGGKLYNTGFSFEFMLPEIKFDLIYILNSAIYQKVNEITF